MVRSSVVLRYVCRTVLAFALALPPVGTAQEAEAGAEPALNAGFQRLFDVCKAAEKASSGEEIDALPAIIADLREAAYACLSDAESGRGGRGGCQYFFHYCMGLTLRVHAEAMLNAGESKDEWLALTERALHHASLSYFRFERTSPAAHLLARVLLDRLSFLESIWVFEDSARNGHEKNYELLVGAGDKWRFIPGLARVVADVRPDLSERRKQKMVETLSRYASKRATEAYRAATRYRPLEETAWQRYIDSPEVKAGDLIEEGQILLARGQPLMAARALERVMAEVSGRSAEEAFVYWTQAKAVIDGLSVEELDRLFKGLGASDTGGYASLGELLQDPAEAPLDWWEKARTRELEAAKKLAVSHALLTLGRRKLSERRTAEAAVAAQTAAAAQAATIFERALGLPFDGLDLEILTARLELWRALAEAYRQLDTPAPPERTVSTVVEGLVDEGWIEVPGSARARYLETAGRLVLESAALAEDPPAAGVAEGLALLEDSVAAGESIEGGEPGFGTAHPFLHETLAGHYEALPEADRPRALSHWLRAATGFLDLDALRPARAALRKACDLGGDATTLAALEYVAALRRNLDLAETVDDVDTLAARATEYVVEQPCGSSVIDDPPSLEGCDLPIPPSPAEQEPLFARLRFRFYADLGAKLDSLGRLGRASECHLRAIETLRDLQNLASSDDVKRIERTARQVALGKRPTIFFEEPIDFRRHFGRIARFEKKVFHLPLPSGPAGLEVRVSEDVFRAAEIRKALVDAELDHPYHLGISGSSAWIFSGCNDAERIQEVKGILKSLDYTVDVVDGIGFRLSISSLHQSQRLPSREEICGVSLDPEG